MAIVNRVIFDLPTVRVEHIICEIIDNSIDAKARNILIDLSKDSEDKSSFQFGVWDDGVGFESEEKLCDSFEIGRSLDTNGNYEDDDIGMFKVGMKLATLSRFNQLHVFSNVAGELHRHAEYPGKSRLEYDHEGSTNPSDQSHSDINIDKIFRTMKSKKFNTCVIGRDCRVKLLSHRKKDIEFLETGFSQHLSYFLGITYQEVLESGTTISIKTPFLEEPLEVEPLDPFWQDFSPTKLLEYSKKTRDAELREFCEKISRFSTLAGEAIDSLIPGKGRIKIEPFIIPSRQVRTYLKQNFPSLSLMSKSKAFGSPGHYGQAKSGSNALQSTNLMGFYFYKGKRCINFGGDVANNNGFYRLPGGVNANWTIPIRIKISYQNRLDDELILHPNKNRFTKISEPVWRAIHKLLEIKCGGQSFAPPFDKKRPFFVEGAGKSQFKSTQERSGIQIKCDACELVHEKAVLCPLVECKTCNQKNQNCKIKKCNFLCPQCSDKHGPISKCPKNCRYCGYLGGHLISECKLYCRKCKSIPCGCSCQKCDQSPCVCEVICASCKEKECVCSQGVSTFEFSPNRVSMSLYKMNRLENIQYLTQTLEEMGISPEELVSE